jgi:primase-polymerase (primpol)-like protein
VVFHLVVRHAKRDCAYGFDTVLIEVTHDDSYGLGEVMKKNYEGFGYDARGCDSF